MRSHAQKKDRYKETGMMIGAATRPHSFHLCSRCNSNPVFFRVKSEILNAQVCVECGLKAVGLGLTVIPLVSEEGSFSHA